MKLLRFLTLGIALVLSLMCFATNHYFHTVDVKDGMADNFVRDITCDSYGYIWISTINGLSRYDGHRFRSFMPQQFGGLSNDIQMVRESADSTLWMICSGELYTYTRKDENWRKDGAEKLVSLGIEGRMKLFYVDDRSNLWVATEEGLYHYDYAQHAAIRIANYSGTPIQHIVSRCGSTLIVTEDYKIYDVLLKERRLLLIGQTPATPFNRDSHVYLDTHSNLWFYYSHSQISSVRLLSLDTRQWRQLDELRQMDFMVNTVIEDYNGNLWIGTENEGIHLFEFNEDGMNRIDHMDAYTEHSSHISCFYLDKNNTMWVGSAKLGIAFTDLCAPTFDFISTGNTEDVSSLVLDHNEKLWIGFDGNGMMIKQRNGSTSYLRASQHQLPSDIITSIVALPDGTILAGTYGSGMAKYDGKQFIPIYNNYTVLNYIKDIVSDSYGNLWVATVDKGVVKLTPDGKMINFSGENSPLKSDGILCLAYDSQDNIIYIGTSVGLYAFDENKGRFMTITSFEKLNSTYITSLMISNSHKLWIGSRNGLWIYQPHDDTISQFTTEQGMSHNTIRALATTMGGKYLWASTDNGLTCISIENDGHGNTMYRCYPFFDNGGLNNVNFSNNAALTLPDGTALFGSFTGYVRIRPENAILHNPKLHVQFTGFRINGQNSDNHTLSDFTIQYGDRPTFFVSAMMPSLSSKIKYLYRFKGEQEWQRAPGQSLYFTGLIPGKHVLQVKAELGFTTSPEEELVIKVLPPIWLSNTAIIIYILVLSAIIYIIYISIRRRQKRELAIKQLEMNLEKYEMEEDKIRFFTNISHDLKTPLTLVVAPLERIREANLPSSIQTEIDVAWRNARQLYDLILQLLDFRKLDVGKEKLNLKHGDIVNFVRQTVQSFTYYSTRKQIKMHLALPPSAIEVNFDESKMRRIITNLLSNAYKYNVDNGTVTVSLGFNTNNEKKEFSISVADTGIGINDKRRVFDRFIQETHGQEQEGSGLGLHIVKQYIDMMGGEIDVQDNKPKGTIFTVTIPVMESASETIEELSTTETVSLTDSVIVENGIQSKPTILVVDDNTDARFFLQRSLDDDYQVLIAANGKEALYLLDKTEHVSVIISDVMMPEMDGIELFRHIKGNIRYSHIPVILLTAKSSEENIVSGLEEGVADYITKPFSLAVLKLRIAKILEWTQNVYGKITTGIDIKPSEITVSSLDEELISHVMENIEANIQDINYSVAQLSSDVGMTRGHLYKKLMAITGKSPLEFMRIIKLKRGKSLLDQGKTNISEVADMVGLSAKQFAHFFKLTYGDTPSDYIKKQKK